MRAGLLQRRHIARAPLHRHDHPRMPAGGEQVVHQESAQPSVTVHVGMDEHEEEMAEHRSCARMGFAADQIEQRRHAITHRLRRERDVLGVADVHLTIAIARQIGGAQYAGRHAG